MQKFEKAENKRSLLWMHTIKKKKIIIICEKENSCVFDY